MQGVVSDPLSKAFPTISNDKSGARSYPKGATEVNARTIKPKVKDFDKKSMGLYPVRPTHGSNHRPRGECGQAAPVQRLPVASDAPGPP